MDTNLAPRGWTNNISGCTSVYDADVGHNVAQCSFTSGKDDPGTTGSAYDEFRFTQPPEEYTIKYKVKISGGWENGGLGGQVFHSFYMISNKGGSPANSWGTTYFDPDKNLPGEYLLEFQDNQSINCPLGQGDFTFTNDNRSVGGYQQQYKKEDNVHLYWWGMLCTGTYSGQSAFSVVRNRTAHPIVKDEWVTLTYYVKLNTPGQFDGKGWMSIQRQGDSAPVVSIDNSQLMFRANGWNKDLNNDKLLFGPWASGNKYTFTAFFTDLEVYSGDAR